MHGRRCIIHWSKTQPVVALSSGEAEPNAVLKGSSEVLGVQSMMREVGDVKNVLVRTDSGACVGMVHRVGTGRIKHLEVRQLWVQEKVAGGRLKIKKISRDFNPSDILTHHWSKGVGEEHMRQLDSDIRDYDRFVR